MGPAISPESLRTNAPVSTTTSTEGRRRTRAPPKRALPARDPDRRCQGRPLLPRQLLDESDLVSLKRDVSAAIDDRGHEHRARVEVEDERSARRVAETALRLPRARAATDEAHDGRDGIRIGDRPRIGPHPGIRLDWRRNHLDVRNAVED